MSTVAARPRPLEQIFPLRGDANRAREMQATWRSFCRDRSRTVKSALAAGRSSPEIAYQLGELLHNHFRTRGVTLTSYELRRLVAELLALHGPPGQDKAADRNDAASDADLPDDPWPGRAVREPDFRRPGTSPPPPSRPPGTASAAPPEPVPFALLLTRVLELVRGRLVSRDRQAARVAVDEAVNSVAAERGGDLPPATREQLVTSALFEVVGLGLIDRLWSDHTVRAILINGPSSVFVDRDGTLQAVPESFRDEAHLLELADRLVARPASGVADLRLRDGSHGVVIFPPVAPTGPVLMLRRAQPGEATLERMVAGGLLDRTVADLLRLGARSRLNMLVTGPPGSGKTALLAALVRSLDAAVPVVTVAAHRQFRWPASSKVELTTSRETPFSALVEAAGRLEPGLLVLDSVQRDDVAALSGWLRRRASGTLASLAPDAMSPDLARAADLVVRIDRAGGGPFKVAAVEDAHGDAVFRRHGDGFVRGTTTPSFAPLVQARGHGEALAQLMR